MAAALVGLLKQGLLAVSLCDAAGQGGVGLCHLVAALLPKVVGPQPSCGRGLRNSISDLHDVSGVVEGSLVAHEGELLREVLLLASHALGGAMANVHDGVRRHGRIKLGI